MIGPGAGGCGMAALFKVLDPLGKVPVVQGLLHPTRSKLWRDVESINNLRFFWPSLIVKIERTLILNSRGMTHTYVDTYAQKTDIFDIIYLFIYLFIY